MPRDLIVIPNGKNSQVAVLAACGVALAVLLFGCGIWRAIRNHAARRTLGAHRSLTASPTVPKAVLSALPNAAPAVAPTSPRVFVLSTAPNAATVAVMTAALAATAVSEPCRLNIDCRL
ncbi:unnamed protein product [Fusarium venenatum]|uniref:Uncharacterized protein n=1 Tax=Fusarium venenatum TaxID=56646 RepID=A0A2L2TZL9_9HYPO|nr:uncharacterized protein FVRRES_10753 [Fusarium venenatum]KAH6967332.1 hypothetical protein EDB82DRAFT_580783 [Fusarium venenatum]CEI70676.1 unnamed protein product [Fusarium venenatum]